MYPPIGISDEDRETFKETRDPMILIELTIDMYVVPVNTGGYFAIEYTLGNEDPRPPYFEYSSDVQKTQKIILKTFRGKMKITVINRHTTDSDIDARHTGVHLNSLGDALRRCHTCRSGHESYCAEAVLEFVPDPVMLVQY